MINGSKNISHTTAIPTQRTANFIQNLTLDAFSSGPEHLFFDEILLPAKLAISTLASHRCSFANLQRFNIHSDLYRFGFRRVAGTQVGLTNNK